MPSLILQILTKHLLCVQLQTTLGIEWRTTLSLLSDKLWSSRKMEDNLASNHMTREASVKIIQRHRTNKSKSESKSKSEREGERDREIN